MLLYTSLNIILMIRLAFQNIRAIIIGIIQFRIYILILEMDQLSGDHEHTYFILLYFTLHRVPSPATCACAVRVPPRGRGRAQKKNGRTATIALYGMLLMFR